MLLKINQWEKNQEELFKNIKAKWMKKINKSEEKKIGNIKKIWSELYLFNLIKYLNQTHINKIKKFLQKLNCNLILCKNRCNNGYFLGFLDYTLIKYGF